MHEWIVLSRCNRVAEQLFNKDRQSVDEFERLAYQRWMLEGISQEELRDRRAPVMRDRRRLKAAQMAAAESQRFNPLSDVMSDTEIKRSDAIPPHIVKALTLCANGSTWADAAADVGSKAPYLRRLYRDRRAEEFIEKWFVKTSTSTTRC